MEQRVNAPLRIPSVKFARQTGAVPPVKKSLTEAQRRALDEATAGLKDAERALERARARWVRVASRMPQSAVAAHLRISPQAVSRRLRGAKRER
jgi:hypothetical protein